MGVADLLSSLPSFHVRVHHVPHYRSRPNDRYLNDQESLILEREPMQRMAADSELMIYRHDGYWHHMDTPYEFDVLNNTWKTGKAPWKIWK